MLPEQSLEPGQLSAFGANFGELEINVANKYHAEDHPEVMILSNIMVDGKQIGLVDAGQLWHTDVSYASEIAFANVLHAKVVPTRDGKPLGDTQFRSMYAAYEDLPAAVKQRLAGVNAVHDFCVFWERMLQRPGTKRQPLTEEQRKLRPPVEHPIFMKHPITGKYALYCNPGFATRIVGLELDESDEMLEFLFSHQSHDKYFYAHKWKVGDVLIWTISAQLTMPQQIMAQTRAGCFTESRSWRRAITNSLRPEKTATSEAPRAGAVDRVRAKTG